MEELGLLQRLLRIPDFRCAAQILGMILQMAEFSREQVVRTVWEDERAVAIKRVDNLHVEFVGLGRFDFVLDARELGGGGSYEDEL